MNGTRARDQAPRPARPAPAPSSIVRSGAWSSLTQVAPAISALVMTPYVVHGLGPDRYGMYVLAINLLSFLGSFDGGLTASAGRYFSVHAGSGDVRSATRLFVTLAVVLLAAGTAGALIVGRLAPLLVDVVHAPADVAEQGAFLIRVMAFVTVGWLLYSICCALVNAHGRFAWTSLSYVAGYATLMAGLAVVLARHGGLHAVAFVLLAQTGVTLLLSLPAALRCLAVAEVGLLSWAELRAYAGFAWKVQIQGLAWLVNSQAASLTSGAVLPVREVGVYNVGANLGLQLKFAPMNGLRPIAARLGRDFGSRGWDATEVFERLQRSWVRAVTGWSAMALGAAWFGVSAWLGPAFERAGIVATVLVAGNVAVLGAGVLLAWLNTVGRPDVEARYSVLSVALNLVLLAALVRPFGIVGTAAATALTQWIAVGYLLRRAAAALPARPPVFLREVPWAAAACTAAVAALLELAARPLLPAGGPGLLLAAAVAAPAGTLYCLWVYGPAQCLGVVRRHLPSPRQGGPMETR